ncbi:MAG: BrnT family toxin [Cypionkella sp.]
MIFEWDEAKNAANKLKHGIGFERASTIFEGWVFTTPDQRFAYGELREISIGIMDSVMVLTVVHTDRNGRRRLISARPASNRERQTYERSLRARIDE